MVEAELGRRRLLEIDHPDSGTLPVVDEEQRGTDHLDWREVINPKLII
jgi:hypothetical protein